MDGAYEFIDDCVEILFVFIELVRYFDDIYAMGTHVWLFTQVIVSSIELKTSMILCISVDLGNTPWTARVPASEIVDVACALTS